MDIASRVAFICATTLFWVMLGIIAAEVTNSVLPLIATPFGVVITVFAIYGDNPKTR